MSGEMFLLKESKGKRASHTGDTHMLVEAENRQQVKYQWHKRQNELGGTQARGIGEKHCYEHHSKGYWVEIAGIKKLKPEEVEVMKDNLPTL